MPHYTKKESWPSAVPLVLLEEVVRPETIEELDPPEVEFGPKKMDKTSDSVDRSVYHDI